MATFTFTHSFPEYLAEGVMNLGTDTLMVMLSNVAPTATFQSASHVTEIASGNGYTAGGVAVSITSSAQVDGIYTLVVGDAVFTASGGPIGPFRYAVFYDDTPSSPANPIIGYHDYGTNLTLLDTEVFTWDAATSGILGLRQAT